MTDQAITIEFRGTSASLQAAAQQVVHSLQGVTAQTQKMGLATQATGMATGMIMADMAKKAMAFAKSAITSFSDVASEVRKMKGIMGGTAEDISRLRFAGEELGVSSDAITRSYRLLSVHMVANDKYAKQLGVSYKNLDGSLRAPQEVLGQVADQLNKLPAGAERSALGAKLFGRGFAELNPLLRQGSEGMKEFAKESDILGQTMSEKDLAAAKQLTMANRQLHAVIKGVFIEIGRTVMPVLASFAQIISHGAVSVRQFINEHKSLGTMIKWLAGIVAVAATVLVQYMTISKALALFEAGYTAVKTALGIATVAETVATEGATVAQWGLNAAMDANPIGVVVLAIEALVVALVFLVKKFEPVGDVIIWFFKMIGTVAGKGVAIFVKYLEFVGVAYINVARIAVKAGEMITGNRFWKTIFGGGANESVKNALKALDGFEAKFKDVADGIAKTAGSKGGEWGEKLGKGLVNGIKNLKLPKIKVPKIDDPTGLLPPEDTGGKGKKDTTEKIKTDLEQRVQAVKDYWTERIKIVKEAYDTAKAVADKAKQDMANIASGVAQSITQGFDINALVQSSYAKYLGADALVALFRKKLADAQEFVADLKALRSQGLNVEMLQQVAAAGVEGGLDTARLLVGNSGVISELNGIQSQISASASEAGTTVSEAVMGQTVLTTSSAVMTARGNLTGVIGEARGAGATVTETTSASGDINVTVDVQTNASPQLIGSTVAWAIATQTPIRSNA